MKKFDHPTDDFFRKIMKDHQITPSDEARQAFLRDAMQVPPPQQRTRKWLPGLSVILIVSAIGIIGWLMIAGNKEYQRSPEPKIKNNVAGVFQSASARPPVGETVNHASPASHSIAPEKHSERPVSQTSGEPVIHDNLMNQNELQYSKPVSADQAERNSNLPASGQASHDQEQSATVTDAPLLAAADQPMPENSAMKSPPQQSTTISQPEAGGEQSPPVASGASQPPDTLFIPGLHESARDINRKGNPGSLDISAGIYYSPEWMNGTLEGTKFVNNFGLEGTFHYGRFSVRTGAGLSIASGTNELVVEYNDYLGAYNKLDSMKFTWSYPSQKFVPEFYLSSQEVWDSLMKQEYARVVKRYTYFQVPLILGYDFWQSERVSMGIRLGPVMSVLLATKQLSAPYDPGKKRIISMNDISPGQVSLNWQAMAGLNTAIRLTRTLQFEVEPWIRYYFNSVYEKPANNTKPWSFGMRAAVVVKF